MCSEAHDRSHEHHYASPMSNWFEAVWPVGAFFLGGLSTHIRDVLTEKRQREREASARSAERNKAILDRRETFELDHLSRLNDALNDLGRAAGRVHVQDSAAGRISGEYAGVQLGGDLSEALLLANRVVHTLMGLVLDDDLRELVGRAQSALNVPSGMHRSEMGAAERAFVEAIILLESAQLSIAARIREIYMSQSAEVAQAT